MDQTTSRLRKTFHYPDDNDSDDSLPEALDEEEQDTLIRTLQQQNQTRNKQYTIALLSISLLSTLPYLATLFQRTTALLSILSITSLLSTAYLLSIFPAETTGLQILDDLIAPPQKNLKAYQNYHSTRTPPLLGNGLGAGGGGPIGELLPLLNLGLCTVLVIAGRVLRARAEMWNGFGWLPGFVYAVVLIAKAVMGSVDPEKELGELRYGFKGA
ncbi:hypothetical protein BP6252_03200 [Coleophoma cylindrospora]|uniref:Uncharacterized protein n=1 Tax=Coleophoma cylindrospora TaxID=1849047 RepID=A0A3D8S732_9HELO|nr:hypothetical protein BP6252_03200 [Coleophoma cylindrospora]